MGRGNETNGWCGHQALGRAGASLAGTRILVTDGAGFIGSHIVDQLVRAGCGVVIVLDNFVQVTRDNLAWAQAKGRVTLVEADIRRQDVIDKMVRHSDFVFHQAAIRNSYPVDPRQAFEVMVEAW
jgi:UDP-glucose 4-epimerase